MKLTLTMTPADIAENEKQYRKLKEYFALQDEKRKADLERNLFDMSPTLLAIHQACETLGARAPKVRDYTNGWAVAMRNADGDRILVLIDHDASPTAVKEKISLAYRTHAEANAMTTDEMLKRVSDAGTQGA